MTTAARDEILARIRATSHGVAAAPPRTYARTGTLPPAELVDRFCERVADYRAEVLGPSDSDVAETIRSCLERHGAKRIGIPPGLPAVWKPPGAELVEDDGLTTRELDTLDGVLTACTIAIAETGTIVLAGGLDEGRRALTLVPDLHICVVRPSQIVAAVPEAIQQLEELVGAERRPLTFISGPSATSDIELSRVEGVHGPRTLIVLVLSEESP